MSGQEYIDYAASGVASGALTQRRFVGYDGAQASAAGQLVRGVNKYDAADGDDITINVGPVVMVEAGDVVAVGDRITTDAEGRAVKADDLQVAAGATGVTSTGANGAIFTGSVLPQFSAYVALDAAGAAGDIIRVERIAC